jgi:serine/threonine protein kinase
LLTEIEILDIYCQLLSGVAYCHMNMIIHRDFKPLNILVAKVLGKDIMKIADFGSSRDLLKNIVTRIDDTLKGFYTVAFSCLK